MYTSLTLNFAWMYLYKIFSVLWIVNMFCWVQCYVIYRNNFRKGFSKMSYQSEKYVDI